MPLCRFDNRGEKPQGLSRIVLHHRYNKIRQDTVDLIILVANTRNNLWEGCVPLGSVVKMGFL